MSVAISTAVTPASASAFGWSANAQTRGVVLVLGLYVIGFFVFPPSALLITDEAAYVGQATLFSRGDTTHEVRHVLQGTSGREVLSAYPVGTSLLQAPFVRLGGWRWAVAVSLLSMIGTVMVSLVWLRELGRPPIFALLPLLYIGTLVQGRIAMSDAVTALVSLLAFWQFSRGERGKPLSWIAAGFFAGLTSAFRDTTPLLFAPLFAGAFVRREPKAWQLLAGGLAGISLRLLSARLLFGSALFLRESVRGGVPLTLNAVGENLPLYLFLLLFVLPLGLPSLLLHRGRRKPELILGVAAMMVVYLSFPLPHEMNGGMRDIVLHSRYCNAIVPLMTLTLSEWIPRLTARRERLQRMIVAGALGSAVLLSFVVHVYLGAYGKTLERIASAIYAKTPKDSVLLINPQATSKFICEARGHRDVINRVEAKPGVVEEFVARGEPVYAVFVDRTETAARDEDARENAQFLAALEQHCRVEVLYDRQESVIERIKIARVTACGGGR